MMEIKAVEELTRALALFAKEKNYCFPCLLADIISAYRRMGDKQKEHLYSCCFVEFESLYFGKESEEELCKKH